MTTDRRPPFTARALFAFVVAMLVEFRPPTLSGVLPSTRRAARGS